MHKPSVRTYLYFNFYRLPCPVRMLHHHFPPRFQETRCTFYVPNLIVGLGTGTVEERHINRLGTEEFGATKVRHKFDKACRIIYATLERH